jgi:N-hydroxyarylamine O-acetyltransferase
MNCEPGDNDSYCARIGYSGPREPTLRAIIAGHTATIPFENLDVLAKRPVRLDLPSVYEKLVRHRRGGYCYEHNLLLLDVLLAFGFRAVGLAARVHRTRPPGVTPPRSHMLLRVDLAEGSSHIVDVGFGTALTAPLVLEPGTEQTNTT